MRFGPASDACRGDDGSEGAQHTGHECGGVHTVHQRLAGASITADLGGEGVGASTGEMPIATASLVSPRPWAIGAVTPAAAGSPVSAEPTPPLIREIGTVVPSAPPVCADARRVSVAGAPSADSMAARSASVWVVDAWWTYPPTRPPTRVDTTLGQGRQMEVGDTLADRVLPAFQTLAGPLRNRRAHVVRPDEQGLGGLAHGEAVAFPGEAERRQPPFMAGASPDAEAGP